MFTNAQLRQIFDRTSGHCHFCGDPVIFEKHWAWDAPDPTGAWEVDHIKQRAKGGAKDASNCLPACCLCNSLRWNRKGENLRELIFLGLIAKEQVKSNSEIGERILELKAKRLAANKKRRRNLPHEPRHMPLGKEA